VKGQLGKAAVLKKLAEGQLIYRRVYMESSKSQRILVAVVTDNTAEHGPNLHGKTFAAIAPSLKVHTKRVNGQEVAADTIPTLSDGDIFETYYTLSNSATC